MRGFQLLLSVNVPVTGAITSRIVQTRRAHRKGENTYIILVTKPGVKKLLWILDLYGRVILKGFLKK